jgi:hypothetical protein
MKSDVWLYFHYDDVLGDIAESCEHPSDRNRAVDTVKYGNLHGCKLFSDLVHANFDMDIF